MSGRASTVLAVFLASCLFSAAGAPSLRTADSLFAAGNYESAVTVYRAILAGGIAASNEVRAHINLAWSLKRLARYDEAITNFDAAISKFTNTSLAFSTGEVSRHEAYHGLAQCLMETKKFERALEVIRETRKHPRFFLCGNAAADEDYRLSREEGICHDHLDHAKEALRSYIRVAFGPLSLQFDPALHFRILTIYEDAGELPKLLSMLDELDAQQLKMQRSFAQAMAADCNFPSNQVAQSVNVPTNENHRLTYLIRRAIELRSFARQGAISNLVEIVKSFQGFPWPGQPHDEAVLEAVRLLAEDAKSSVPELIRTGESVEDVLSTALPYVLGRCGSPEALQWLKDRALLTKDIMDVSSIIAAIRVAGEKARPVLNTLVIAARTNPTLAHALRQPYLELISLRSRAEQRHVGYPTHPLTGPLPGSLKELLY